jgi:hypothetical protein
VTFYLNLTFLHSYSFRPARLPCDEAGCDSLSVRGTKCKAHADPSKKCLVGGCRKGACYGGLCKRHQNEVLSTGGIKAPTAAAAEATEAPAPSVRMHAPTNFPSSGLAQLRAENEYMMCQAVAERHVLASMGMGFAPYPYAAMLVPGNFLGNGMGTLGLGGGDLHSRQLMGMNLYARELAQRSKPKLLLRPREP